MCDSVRAQLCPLSVDTAASGRLPRLEAGTCRGQAESGQMLAGSASRAGFILKGGEAAGDLAGAGDSLTVLGCLYTVNAASGSALGSLQEMGWFPTKLKVRSVFIFAGLLRNTD